MERKTNPIRGEATQGIQKKENIHSGTRSANVGMSDGIVEYTYLLFSMRRTAGALGVKWKVSSRGVHHLLSARKAPNNIPMIGATDGGMDDLTIRLYCMRVIRKDKNGQEVYEVPFIYVDAVEFLSQHPKIGGRSGEDSDKLRNSSMGIGDLPTGMRLGAQVTLVKVPGVQSKFRVPQN